MKPKTGHNLGGIAATLLSTFFFGLAPIIGKLAYQAGVDAATLVTLRTALAAGLLWLFYLLCGPWRRYVRISWRNLAGCVGMGISNGIGSLLYYNGLTRVDASLAHLLYSMYPFWVFIFLSAAGHPVSRLVVLRLGLALLSVFLLTWQGAGLVDPLGVTLMISSGALYGWHLVLGQWTLADVDSRTVTLYGLTTMAVVVGLVYLAQGHPGTASGFHPGTASGFHPGTASGFHPGTASGFHPGTASGFYLPEPFGESIQGLFPSLSPRGWMAILLLAIFPTALARLLAFAGLQRLGGVQTSLLGIAELLVAVVMAFALLGESFTLQQWLGCGAFVVSVLLIAQDTSLQIVDEESWWLSLFPPSDGEPHPGTASGFDETSMADGMGEPET